MKYIWKKCLQELIWAHFYGRPNCSNGIKIHLDGYCLLYICTWSQLPVVDEAQNSLIIDIVLILSSLLLLVYFNKKNLFFHKKFIKRLCRKADDTTFVENKQK